MLDAPPEDDWAGRDGAVARCIKGLGISKGSAGTVRDVFTLTTYAALNDEAYDPGTHTVTTARIGRPPLLATDGPEAQIVADEMEGGGSRKSATEAVNDWRLKRGLIHVGEGAVYSLTKRLGVNSRRVGKAPQGNFDPDSAWALARFNWARQLAVMFGEWNWDPADGACPPEFDPARLSSIQQQQVAWWDETAKKCVLDGSHTSKYHHRFKRDADGKLDQNGELAPLIKRLVPKFQQRSDIVVGVAIVELAAQPGVLIGRRCEPVDYTGRWVCTEATMDDHRRGVYSDVRETGSRAWVTGARPKAGVGVELFEGDPVERIVGVGPAKIAQLAALEPPVITVRDLMERGVAAGMPAAVLAAARTATPGVYVDASVDHRKSANPYESRYGASWRTTIDAESAMHKYVSIQVLWAQIMASTINCFAGTTHEKTFRIYHDALSQLTCEATKVWLRTKQHEGRTWFDIWVTPELDLNRGTVYAGRPVGNSPEMMPLDCSLLSDLGHDLSRHVRMTKALASDDPLKFSRSTPKRLASSLLRLLWPVSNGGDPVFDAADGGCPSSSRIVEDVKKCSSVHLRQIIEARGAMVPGIGTRSGRRERQVGGHGGAGVKQPAAVARWIHPHAKPAALLKVEMSMRLSLSRVGVRLAANAGVRLEQLLEQTDSGGDDDAGV